MAQINIHNNFGTVNVNQYAESKQGEDIAPQETKPGDTYILPIPTEGKYSEVRKYMDERKKFDDEFKEYCKHHSLRDLCTRLTNEFGWLVDENSLQRNLNRNR